MKTTNTQNNAAEVSAQNLRGQKRVPKFFTAGNLAVMGILTAISFILYVFVKFPLPFIFPAFLDIQFSDLPALLGGFSLGPIAGCLIIIVKCCLKMPMSSTACVGELADIIVGIAFVLPASLLYRFHKNRRGAILGMLLGMFCAVIAAIISNRFLLIPFFAKNFGGMEAIAGMMSGLYPNVTPETVYNYYLPLAVLPFNILRCSVCAVLTYFTYKPLSKALHWEIKHERKNSVAANVSVSSDNSDVSVEKLVINGVSVEVHKTKGRTDLTVAAHKGKVVNISVAHVDNANVSVSKVDENNFKIEIVA